MTFIYILFDYFIFFPLLFHQQPNITDSLLTAYRNHPQTFFFQIKLTDHCSVSTTIYYPYT